MSHPNSKIVFLKRTQPFKHESMSSDVMQEQLSFTKRSVGSYFASKDSPRMGTGLTIAEEKILIPALLGIEVNQEFYTKLTLFYTEIDTKVPHGNTGLQLEVGLELDNNKPVTYTEKLEDGSLRQNLPINIDNYIRYRHALGSYLCAKSPEEANGNQLYWFYIEDPKLMIAGQIANTEVLDKAFVAYAQAKTDPKKVKMLVTVMKGLIRKKAGKPPVNINGLGQEELVLQLRELATEQPEKFYALANDQDLKKRYFIDECLSIGLIQRQGNAFIDREAGQSMGDTIKEVVIFLWNPKEAQRLQRIKFEYDKAVGKPELVE